MMQDRHTVLYDKVKDLYEQAKSIWKGVLFEILLDPINPEPGEMAERHIIDYRDCVEDFELNDGEPDRELTLDELFAEIGKLRDYKNILKAANESIENIKEQYKDKYTVTLIRVLDYSTQENLEIDLFDSESETETEEDTEPEEDWYEGWESDSGVESPAEYEQQPHLYSPEGSEIDNESDSGLQTESDAEAEWLLNWESGSESTRPATPDPNQVQEYDSDSNSDNELKSVSNENEELVLNWDSDSESNIAEPSLSREYSYETDEESKSDSSENEMQFGLDSVLNKTHNKKLLSSVESSENSALTSNSLKLDLEVESIHNSSKDEFITLGPNCTTLRKSDYDTICWKTARSAASALLLLIFGERAPPYCHLNQRTLADIYAAICSRCNISRHEAQSIIESECLQIFEKELSNY